jgi:type I restriction enzyme S subunit
MFGDYILNPDNYTFRKLNDVAVGNGIKCGPFGTQLSKSEFCEIGIPLWGIKHVNSGFTLQTNEYVTPEKAQKLADYDIVPGDIVMTRKGTVGNCSVYPEHYNVGIMHSDLLRIRADSKKIDYIFLDSQLKYSRNVNAQLQRVSSGAIMAGINVSKLKNIEVFVPDIKIQKQYSEVVKKHTEFICRLSYFAQSANCCFSSLQQRAFRGDL